MKINKKSLEFANCLIGNISLPIPFYMPVKKKKLSPLGDHVYKLQTNPKDEKLIFYLLTVKTGYPGWGSSLLFGKESTEGRHPTSIPEQGGKPRN
eukprot:4621831-Ditylum_brightwellii.AAC.1